MEDNTIRLNDGTILNGFVTPSGDNLYVHLPTTSMADAFVLLSDKQKTQEITAMKYGVETVYQGFTHIYYVKEEDEGGSRTGLRKG